MTNKKHTPAGGGRLASGKNTGSAASVSLLDLFPTEGSAVANPPAEGTAMPSVGGNVSLAIDDRGELAVYHPQAGLVRFTPDQTLALGDFLRLSEPLWRP